jgi:hypothetical protein
MGTERGEEQMVRQIVQVAGGMRNTIRTTTLRSPTN